MKIPTLKRISKRQTGIYEDDWVDFKLKGLETNCVCRENSLLSVDLILVSAFGIIHLGNYPLVILQSGINSEFEI